MAVRGAQGMSKSQTSAVKRPGMGGPFPITDDRTLRMRNNPMALRDDRALARANIVSFGGGGDRNAAKVTTRSG